MKKNERPLKDKLFIAGIILLTTSFLACVYSFWLLIYGIPVFVIGVLCLWFSSKPVRTKLWLTVIPILSYVPLTYLFLLVYNHDFSAPQTLLIPADYNGMVRIVYEEPCGITPTEEDGQEVLSLPKSGILILQTEMSRFLNFNYFLVDNKGKRTKIREALDANYRFSTRPVIIPLHSGTWNQTALHAKPGQELKSVPFSDFYLFNTDTTDYRSARLDQQLDSLMEATLQACRQKQGI